jgi:hypothetical protein
MSTTSRRPLVPEDLHNGHNDRRAFNRLVAAYVLGKLRHESPAEIIRKTWRDDPRLALLTRAPVTPPASPVTGISQTRILDLLLIAPGSAAAKVFARCMQLDFTGVYQFNIPHAASHATPLFSGEGLPMNVVMSPVATTPVGPVRKLGFITSFTRELAESAAENFAAVIGRLLGEAAAKSLDAAVFSNAAADSTRPAGLLNGVVALTGATGATTADMGAADVAAFAQAMSDAAINPENMIIVASPKSAWNLRMALGFQTLPLPILMSPAVPAGTVIAIAPEAVASGYEGEPEIDVAQSPSMHFDDSVPLDLVTGGVAASPAMSTFQKEMLALKLRVRCAWGSLQPGAVQYTTTAKW